MRIQAASLRSLAEEMLTMVDVDAWRIEGDREHFSVRIAGRRIRFDAAAVDVGYPLEQLASAVEAIIAHERVQAMLAAAGHGGARLPLWIVSGSDLLGKWLEWSGAGKALSKELKLTDRVGEAPVIGELDRRARREIGHDAANIRVLGGMAVAQRIEISQQPRCIAAFGQDAHLRIAGASLPETVLSVFLAGDSRRNDRPALSDVVDHPFLAAADPRVKDMRNENGGIVIDLESRWTPLARVPSAALATTPHDADPAVPWRATAREIIMLDDLVEQGRHRE